MSHYETGLHELRPCPYFPEHKVAHTRWATHVANCAKRAPRVMTCPYFAGHKMEWSKYEHHVTKVCEYLDEKILADVVRPSLESRKQFQNAASTSRPKLGESKSKGYVEADTQWDFE